MSVIYQACFSQVLFRVFFFCTKINMNAKLMDPKGRHHLNVGSVLVK